MKTICHRCQHLWRSKGKHLDRECPKCGSEYTGPTAKGGGLLGSLLKLVVILGVVGGAGYFYAKRAKEAPPEPEAAAAKTGDRPEGAGQDDPAPKAAPTKAPTKAPAPTRAPSPKPTAEPSDPPTPEPTTPSQPTGPKLKLSSQAGVALGGSYMVRGAIKNVGQTEATGVTVEVRFYAGSKRLAKMKVPDFPTRLGPDARERFKISYTGRGAEAVTRFKVKIRKD